MNDAKTKTRTIKKSSATGRTLTPEQFDALPENETFEETYRSRKNGAKLPPLRDIATQYGTGSLATTDGGTFVFVKTTGGDVFFRCGNASDSYTLNFPKDKLDAVKEFCEFVLEQLPKNESESEVSDAQANTLLR